MSTKASGRFQIELDEFFLVCNDMYSVVVSNIFYIHPYLGKISNLTNILQTG